MPASITKLAGFVLERLSLQEKMIDTHANVPAFTVSNVSGIIYTPASSFMGEMSAAHTISMKSAVLIHHLPSKTKSVVV